MLLKGELRPLVFTGQEPLMNDSLTYTSEYLHALQKHFNNFLCRSLKEIVQILQN